MKTTELNLTKEQIEQLIFLMDDKYKNSGMFYKTKLLYDKLKEKSNK
tara:strand:- start:1856 stop:1996 length:141 start_codon:yes stop_codon:yes gene_type:complete